MRCTESEKTRQITDEDGTIREIYVPGEDVAAEELYKTGIATGINFSKYEDIEVKLTGENKPRHITSFDQCRLRPI